MDIDVTLRLGKRMMARGELSMHTRFLSCPKFIYTFYRNDVDIYKEGDLSYNILYNQFQAELIPINLDLRHFNLQMGLRWDYMHYRNTLDAEHVLDVDLKNEHLISYRARVNYNSEDNWYFPSRGARFQAEYAYMTDNFVHLKGKAGMSDVSGNWRKSFTFGNRFTLQPMVYGRILLGANVPTGFENTVGGEWFGHYVEQQMPFAGIGNLEHVSRQFIAVQLQAQQRMGGNHYLLLRLAGAQQSRHLDEILDHRTVLGAQLAYYLSTMFGPLGASVGYSTHTKEPYFYINLGFVF
jgi:NTE family protein